MGVSGISIWQLLIILLIVILLFGTKRLKNIGSDLGEAIRGFRNSLTNPDKDKDESGNTAHLNQSAEPRPAETQPRAEPSAQRDRV